MNKKIPPIRPSIGIDRLQAISVSAAEVVEQVRAAMLSPTSKKSTRPYTAADLAQICQVDKSAISKAKKKGGLPEGKLVGNRVEWTQAEAIEWVRALRADELRDPMKAGAVVIATGNFKGGVSKTTTSATLAQGLSLRGHKVLVIDQDPQGSLTTLFGILPDVEVGDDDTLLSVCSGDQHSILPLVKPTYWAGVDLVPAAPSLYNAEFILPARQTSEKGFKFWNVLRDSLQEPARLDIENATVENAHEFRCALDIYDVIIIDTPPSLSYLTYNGLMAADGVVMPLPPNALDFSSSTIFWRLFTEMIGGLLEQAGENKSYRFVDILLSRVDHSDAVSDAVRSWILSAYGGMVLPLEIPKTSTAATASAEFGTVYDLKPGSASSKTLARARDAYERMVDYIERQIQGCWAADAEDNASLGKGEAA